MLKILEGIYSKLLQLHRSTFPECKIIDYHAYWELFHRESNHCFHHIYDMVFYT